MTDDYLDRLEHHLGAYRGGEDNGRKNRGRRTAMSEPIKPMTAADEARAWIQRLVRIADECNAQNEAEAIPEVNCPPTHVSAVVRLKPLPDGRVSVYEPGVEVTPDRLRAFLAEHDEQRDRGETAERALTELQQRLGETAEEWGVRRAWSENAETREGYAICESEEHAGAVLDHYRAVDRAERSLVKSALAWRIVGEWRLAEQQPEGGAGDPT
ncbi:hypothetical protein Caci_2911 [Catenulispora acidiphila DSM 44928]|uniref:Uncharacterized protein n=1 Tax=Catenulispora acidiphila (strain DSM 44928 / JCM 14897 / NBRC 102108 / NRRL B-24433 / ID139908) TaxID=479433 RepID=C7Q2S8_CATAD|nr:hypothetical protein [Catenulispora acidiphila]ACU71820.1 hypothetical protein Caci_2911 [Catenulispora acidiphila DSM 44928]